LPRWLIKEEPSSYSFQDLVRDGRTVWEGVKNPLALKHLRAMKKGDPVFYYHTGKEKSVVGIARVVADSRSGPRGPGGPAAVEIAPVKPLPEPVSLLAIKARRTLKDFPLVRISRLSVMPVTEAEWKEIEAMAGSRK
jgi:predicted RNA-binding protein with PUA-like domain